MRISDWSSDVCSSDLQLLILVVVALYLRVLSLPAFVLTAVFATASIFVHLSRMQPVTTALRQAAAEDDRLFDGLRDLLLGFSQVRTSRPRAAALHAELEALSDGARVTKTAVKKRWGNEFALIQVMFYLLVGLIVFAVPLDRKSTRLNSSHYCASRMPSSA